ncbi:SLOG family protein [Nonomuraea sp. NPDC050556]|uniref:SLOG family protein n=1 Tax=Nonomuraea sp. NPDC050556 TaxID=3364369 RepID=UPI0037AB79B1
MSDQQRILAPARFRVLVTGSRTWRQCDLVDRALSALRAEHGALVVVHGACPTGADGYASAWVMRMAAIGWDVVEEYYPANWAKGGKKAGPRRNREMVDRGADLVLAFIRDGSPGATQCARYAESKGLPVRRVIA